MDSWDDVKVWRGPRGRGRSHVFRDQNGQSAMDCVEGSVKCDKSLGLPDVLEKIDVEQCTDIDLGELAQPEKTSPGTFIESSFHREHGCLGCGLLDHKLSDGKCRRDFKMNWGQKVKHKEMTMSKGDYDDFMKKKEEKTQKWAENLKSKGWIWCQAKKAFTKTINGVQVIKK